MLFQKICIIVFENNNVGCDEGGERSNFVDGCWNNKWNKIIIKLMAVAVIEKSREL